MAAHAEGWRLEGKFDGFLGSAGAGHERSAGDEAGGVEFDDAAIDAGGQAEIVGVDDETAHGVSLSIAAELAVVAETAGLQFLIAGSAKDFWHYGRIIVILHPDLNGSPISRR
jgi:hypothetical protein